MYQTLPISQAGGTGDRKGIIGGSQVGAVLGLEGYVTQYDVYLAFTGQARPITAQTEETFAFGHILEESIAQMFTFKTGMETVEVPYVYVVPEEHHLLIHVDREIVSTDGRRRALECKTVSSYAAGGWVDYDNLNLPYITTDRIPPQYLAQVYWYYALGWYDEVYISRMTNNKLWTYLVPRPERQVLDAMVQTVKAFYDRLVAGWVPPMRSSDRRANPVREDGGKTSVTADAAVERACMELKDVSAQIRTLEEREKKLKDDITGFIGSATWLVDDGGRRLASWSTQSRTSIDSARLRQEMPDVWKKYAKTGESRILRLCDRKGRQSP